MDDKKQNPLKWLQLITSWIWKPISLKVWGQTTRLDEVKSFLVFINSLDFYPISASDANTVAPTQLYTTNCRQDIHNKMILMTAIEELTLWILVTAA